MRQIGYTVALATLAAAQIACQLGPPQVRITEVDGVTAGKPD